MKPSMKESIGRSLGKNKSLDKKALELKKSWDEVSKVLNSKGKKKK